MTDDANAELLHQLAAAAPGSPERERLRERLVVENLPLVRYLARGFATDADALEDLVQVGSVGLVKAVDRFDPAMGSGFAAYAAPTIIGEIRRYLRDSSRLVRAPRRAFELQAAVARAREDLHHELGRSPTLSQIADRVGTSADAVVETLEVMGSRHHQPLDRTDTADAADAVPAHRLAFEDLGFANAEDRVDLASALAILGPHEQRVLQLRFGEGRSQRDIAADLGVSQMQISRSIQRSLLRLRAVLEGSQAP